MVEVVRCQFEFFFFFNDTATTEIYTLHIVGSVRCVQETGINAEYMGNQQQQQQFQGDLQKNNQDQNQQQKTELGQQNQKEGEQEQLGQEDQLMDLDQFQELHNPKVTSQTDNSVAQEEHSNPDTNADQQFNANHIQVEQQNPKIGAQQVPQKQDNKTNLLQSDLEKTKNDNESKDEKESSQENEGSDEDNMQNNIQNSDQQKNRKSFRCHQQQQ
eukprot:TRINITY_DN10989_c0_g1_i2.p2 TRINITY_DN10989_c0_g1~~TRINITY_DN10989_c0_g1_i2.p2  ORF type:complete len:215 (+),score=70.46 TRINITY_DN10989_c0_g1_i2:86-730(+)